MHDTPFPLTEIQESFFVGRTVLGGRGAEVHVEFDARNLDVARMEHAWNRLVAVTDMLRTTVRPDGTQTTAATVPAYRIQVCDLRGHRAAEQADALARLRDPATFDPAVWPLFSIRVALLGDGVARVLLAVDEMAADGPSVSLLLRQWYDIYRDDTTPSTPGITFQEYARATSGPPLADDLDYWRDKLTGADLDRPAPFTARPGGDDTGRRRLSQRLSAADWAAAAQVARTAGVTSSTLLLTLYTSVLDGAGRPVVLTTYNRRPLHPDVPRLVGPLISTAVFLSPGTGGTLRDRLGAAQSQLWRDLEHGMVSGIRALREWTRRDRPRAGTAIPVVFTSLLGSLAAAGAAVDPDSWVAAVDDAATITHTPGVHLECCVQQSADGGLVISWDYAPGVLDEEAVRAAFERLSDLLRQIARDGDTALAATGEPVAAVRPDITGLPLTEVQSAYVVGRTAGLAEDTETRVYQELELRHYDLDRLETAWRRLVAHHPALRASVEPDGTLTVRGSVPPYEIARYDLTTSSPARIDEHLAAAADRMSSRRFGLGHWPMFAVEATGLPDDTLVLHLAFDALCADAQSIALLLGQLIALHDGRDDVLDEQAADLVGHLRSVAGAAQLPAAATAAREWAAKFAALPAGPALADSGPRVHRRFDLPWAPVRERAATVGVPVDMLLLTAYVDALRERFLGPFTVVVVSWDRPAGRETMIGDFTGLAWLTVDDELPAAADERAREIWRRVRVDLDRGADDPGLGHLRRRVFRARGALRLPVVFTRLPDVPTGLSAEGVRVRVTQSQTAQVALDNVPLIAGDELICQWDAAGDALPTGDLDALFAGYERRVREAVTAAPAAGAPSTLSELLEAAFARHADVPAVHGDGAVLDYAELDRRTGRLAARLIRHGCRPGDHVGVHMDRSADLVTALVAVVRAGGVYVPVDPGNPPDRVRFLVEDAEAGLLLTDRAHAGVAAAGARVLVVGDPADDIDEPAPWVPVGPADPVYMIYTSGTTGRPKGCRNTHHGVANRLLWMQDRFPLNGADRVLQKTPYGFDVSAWEFFWPLLTGAAIVVARPGGHQDTGYLARLIADTGVTVTHFVPPVLDMFLRDPSAGRCTGLRYVFASGEALPLGTMRQFFAILPGVELHNLYGPTEAAIDVTHWPCRADWPGPTVPIGRPVANTTIHLLDDRLQPVAEGTPGEICIGGVQVALGYHRRPELTAERFVTTGHTGRVYRTGDLGRWSDDGELLYLGRIDNQFKLRGMRIEPEEIEAALVERAGCADARVLPVPGGADGPSLGALCVATGEPLPVGEIRRALAGVLPASLVPSRYRFVPRLPLTPNGKLDRAAAAALFDAPDSGATRPGANRPGPNSDLLATVTAVAAEALGTTGLAADADLFDLGATSFTAIRIAQELERRTGRQLPVDAFIDTPTAAGLTAALGGPAPDTSPPGAVAPVDAAGIATIAAELLGLDRVATDDDLFTLGATSFTMIRLAQTVQERHGAEVAVDALIDDPSPAGIARQIAGPTVPPVAAASGPDIRIAFDPAAKKAFQQARIAERRLPEDLSRVPLGPVPDTEAVELFDAASFRDFSTTAMPAAAVNDLLSLLVAGTMDGRRKRRYPSAGGFYPVQVYVQVRDGRVTGLEGGFYYLDPGQRCLVRMAGGGTFDEDAHVAHNRPVVASAALAVYLVSTPAAIAPAYGARLSARYSAVEAGHIAQLAMTAGPRRGLGFCPVGEMNAGTLRTALRLDDDQEVLLSLWGGALTGDALQRRASLTEPAPDTAAPDTAAPVAVVGFAARLPGAGTLNELDALLHSGATAIGPVPGDRWAPLAPRSGRGGVKIGGYLADVTAYESDEFGIGPAEAHAVDPQERLLLGVTRACLEDAGTTAGQLSATGPVGVFVGAMWADHALYGVGARARGEDGTHATRAGLAHRISHAFDLSGPSVLLDSGCVSGLAAVADAVHALRSGRCTAAVAAASNLVLHPDHLDVLAQLGLIAEEADSCAFTDRASGWVVGEGIGAVLLKPLDRAIADGDPIHAVIRGAAVRHSGATRQFGLPHRARQEETLRAALADADLPAGAIGYVEAAASGAALADALEVQGVARVFADAGPVPVGSMKPTLGHLEAASVFGQLGKVICQFRSGRLYGTRLTAELSTSVAAVADRAPVVHDHRPWPPSTGPDGVDRRRALINGFAGTGSYGCLVVEAPPPVEPEPATGGPHLLPLSADTLENLAALAGALAAAAPGAPLAAVARTLQHGRAARPERALVVAGTAEEAGRLLGELAASIRDGSGRTAGTVPAASAGLAAGWLAGQPVSWPAPSTGPRVALPVTPLATSSPEPVAPPSATVLAGDGPVERLTAIVTAETGIDASRLTPASDLLALGVTSRQLQRIAARVTAEGGHPLALETLFETVDLDGLATAAFGGDR